MTSIPSLRIGSVFGISIEVGVSFLLVLPLVTYLIGSQIGPVVGMLNQISGIGIDPGTLTVGMRPWLLGAAAALGLFAGVVLHEHGHSLLAIGTG